MDVFGGGIDILLLDGVGEGSSPFGEIYPGSSFVVLVVVFGAAAMTLFVFWPHVGLI